MDAPRLAPTGPDDWDDDTRGLIDAAGDLNIFRTFAHHPKLLKRWLVFGSHVLVKSTLPAREREIVVLRTGWRCHSPYEFGQHTVIGGSVGVTDDEIGMLVTEGTSGWSPRDATLVTAVDELVADHDLTDTTWEALSADWDDQQILDLIFTVGQYTLVSTALNALRVEIEPGAPGFPE